MNNSSVSKLWLYNLHYFDDLNASNMKKKRMAFELIDRWIDENPPGKGVDGILIQFLYVSLTG